MANEQFPLLNHKPALMRAFQATLRAGDANGTFAAEDLYCTLNEAFPRAFLQPFKLQVTGQEMEMSGCRNMSSRCF